MKERGQQSLQSSVFQSLDIKGPSLNQNTFMQSVNPTNQGSQNSNNQAGVIGQQSAHSHMNSQNNYNKKKISDRPLNLAEMMKSQGAYKQLPNKKNENGQMMGGMRESNQNQQDFIRGTQVMKDFQLIAEPILPKVHGQNQTSLQSQNIFNSLNQPNLNKQNSKNNNGGSIGKTFQSQSHPHTAISDTNNENKDSSIMMANNTQQNNVGGNNLSQMSATSSKMVLDNYYNTTSKQGGQESQNIQEQSSNIFAQNRSVAAKAGQMQIFNNDISQRALKQQQLNQENQISIANKARKFVSPSNTYANNKHGNNGQLQGNSVQQNQFQIQQQENDIRPVKIRNTSQVNNNGAINNNPKYIDYINRFQPADGINGKGRPTLTHAKTQGDTDYNQENQDCLLENSKIEGWGQTSPDQQKTYTNNVPSKHNNMTNKSKQMKHQALQNLNVSGEQMHIEEKNMKKGLNTSSNNGYDSNNTRGSVGGSGQINSLKFASEYQLAGQEKRGGVRGEMNQKYQSQASLYDYLIVQISQDVFEKEFANKVKINSDLMDSFRLKRLSQNPQISTNLTGSSNSTIGELGPKTSTNQTSKLSDGYFSPKSMGSQNNNSTLQDYNSNNQSQVSKPEFQLHQTSVENVKVIAQNLEATNQNIQEIDEESYHINLKSYVSQITQKLTNCGKTYKISNKKKYLKEAFENAKSQQGTKIAKFYVIVINTCINSSSQTIQDTLNGVDSSSDSIDEETKTISYNNPTEYSDQQNNNKNSRTSQIVNKQNKNVKNISTIQPKGYESENEVRSMNSTTTSSTMPFLPTRNESGPITNKSSARSLSQKGNTGGSYQRRLQQKQMSMDEAQISANLILSKDPSNQPQTSLVGGKEVQTQKYPPTKIKIVQNAADYNHHEQHKINKALNNYNNMIQVCFRTKGKLNIPLVLSTAKSMGIVLNKNMFNDQSFKSREHANMIKEKLICYLCKTIQEESMPEGFDTNADTGINSKELTQLQAQPQQLYKCFVGKGNNSILIRTLFKTRFWWLLHDKEEIERVNFMWTQIRKNTIIETFSCKFEDKKSGLKQNNALHMTPKTSASKLKKKRKNQLQSSSQSLESSTDKKDTQTNKLGGIIPGDVKASTNVGVIATNEQQQAAQLAVKLYNKLEDNFHLSNKKALFLNMKNYYDAMGKDVFSAVPVTFHIKEGFEDVEFIRFKNYYQKEDEEIKKQKADKLASTTGGAPINTEASGIQSVKKNIWIIKPGENTNRGVGIQVAKDYEEIKKIIDESTTNKKRTCIVQKYIHNPLLINKRKFDIRAYAFLTSINGSLKGYWYADGYLRTSCREFTLNNLANRMIHLTNDAVQKHAEDYGKYEPGNKLSYTDFQNYIDKHFTDQNICFERDLLPQMKKLTTDTFRAVYGKIDPKRRVNTFEIYGLDFMFDDEFKTYLIEVNTNPCLELGCPLLARLIPNMVENALRITIDPLFPPPENFSQKKCIVNDICPDNKFELIFDEKVDGPYLNELMKEKNNIISKYHLHIIELLLLVEIDEEELSDCDEREDGDN